MSVGGRQVLILACGLAAVTFGGCADLDILPSWVPFQGPASDEMPGVKTPAERISDLRVLSEKAASSGTAEKERIAHQLVEMIRTEKDPLIRVEILHALGRYPSVETDAVLKAAMSDADSDVRMAACRALGQRGDSPSVKLLSDALRTDVEADVRLAAAKALGETRNQDAVASLGEALNDSDPAMQYRAVLSLRQITGKDLGNDVVRWQQYVKGELPEPEPSLAERFRRMF
jgi:HEAT repeat protein